jgi:hypothetical protein
MEPEFQDQWKELYKYATPDIVEKFYNRLLNNFGENPLSFPRIEVFFQSGLHKSQNNDLLQIFIDTVRMLKLLGRGSNDEIRGLNEVQIRDLHDKLISEFGNETEVNEVRARLFSEATEPFKYLTTILSEDDYIKAELIETLKELNDEGSGMNHCIASYFQYIIDKNYIALRIYNLDIEERLTLGLYRKNDELFFNQLKGYGNTPATKESCLAVVDWCNENRITILPTELNDFMPIFLPEKD